MAFSVASMKTPDVERLATAARNLDLLTAFSRTVTEELNEDVLINQFLSVLRQAGVDFAYLYASKTDFPSQLNLHSATGVDDLSTLPRQISRAFVRQALADQEAMHSSSQEMSISLSRLLGPFSSARDWIVAAVPSRQRPEQMLLVAGVCKGLKLQRDLIENVIAYLGLGFDKIMLIESAQMSNRSKSAFLANMSHEIRTPLNALMGFSEILVTGKVSDARRTVIANSIRKNSEYLIRLIDDILDLSKIEAGKLRIEKRNVSLQTIISEIKSVVDLKANQRDLKFNIVTTGLLPSQIQIDEIRLKQIVHNLINNSLKFTNQGSVTLGLSCVRRSESQGELMFFVEDTGVGMSLETQSQLFQPFSQGDASSTRRFGGSGLGLALSSRLAEEMGGSLRLVRSIKDVGTVFELVIPTGDVSGAKWVTTLETMMAPSAQAESPIGKELKDYRILLVEDSVDNQEIFSYFLTNAGADVSLVDNGPQALDEGLRRTWDAILMDIQIPGIDGKEVTRRLRAQGLRCPIIALTAHAMREERESCLLAGCDGQITKPVGEREFIGAVSAFLTPLSKEVENGQYREG